MYYDNKEKSCLTYLTLKAIFRHNPRLNSNTYRKYVLKKFHEKALVKYWDESNGVDK